MAGNNAIVPPALRELERNPRWNRVESAPLSCVMQLRGVFIFSARYEIQIQEENL